MAEVGDLARMLEMAERAATTGDLASAEQLLRSAADLQQAALGPLHPDLANTLNNLGIVIEKSGRPADAETFYRRAVAITAASLPPDHPMAVASRDNLEAFCRACGVPIEAPVVVASPPKPVSFEAEAKAAALARDVATPVSPLEPVRARGSSSARAWMAIVAAVLLAAAFSVWRPWSSQESPAPPLTPRTAPPPASPPPTERAQPDRPAPAPVAAPIEPQPPPASAARAGSPAVVSEPPPPPVSAGTVTVASAQLCQTFSTSTSPWRCDPATDLVPAGPIVLYTRIRSPRDAEIVHRWYRGDTLRQAVTLKIRASAKEGFRTYSRQTVDSGDWRVEVRTADGALLHEGHVTVR